MIMPAVLTALFAVLYSLLSLARWARWEAPSWDNAIFEQAIKGYANLGAPIVDIKGPGYHQLGDHFSPLLVVIAPFYRMFPDPRTLLIAQAVLIAVSVWPITRYAMKRLGWSGVAFGLAYGASWGLQSAVDVQFHEYCLAVPILAFGLVAFLEQRWRASAIWVCLLMGVKEDLGSVVAVFGLVLWLHGQRRLGKIVAAIGALGMVLVLTVIIPFFNPWNQFDYWNRIDTGGEADSGGSLGELITSIMNPDTKIATVGLMLVITLGLAIRSPIALMALPPLAVRFVSETHWHWGTSWHYSSFLMPILFVAALDALDRLPRTDLARWFRRGLPVGMLAVCLALLPHYPLWTLTKPDAFTPHSRVSSAQEVLALIPQGSSVESDLGLIVRLTKDHRVFWVGDTADVYTGEDVAPDYVLIDAHGGWSPSAPEDIAAYAEQRHPGHTYRQLYNHDGYRLAQRID